MTAIHADGRAYCSNAVIGGRFGLRACIVNVRTEAADVERLPAVAAERRRARAGAGRLRLRPARHGEARLVGEHDRLHAVAQAELHQQRATCVLTVVSLTNSSAAISALDSPRAISRKTSSSRAVSSSRPGGGVAAGGGRRRTPRSAAW